MKQIFPTCDRCKCYGVPFTAIGAGKVCAPCLNFVDSHFVPRVAHIGEGYVLTNARASHGKHDSAYHQKMAGIYHELTNSASSKSRKPSKHTSNGKHKPDSGGNISRYTIGQE